MTPSSMAQSRERVPTFENRLLFILESLIGKEELG